MLATRRWEKAAARLRRASLESAAAMKEFTEARRLLLKELTTCAADLTNREVQVLGLLQDKKSDKEIAVATNISTRTAKFHVSNILRKFTVVSRYDL